MVYNTFYMVFDNVFFGVYILLDIRLQQRQDVLHTQEAPEHTHTLDTYTLDTYTMYTNMVGMQPVGSTVYMFDTDIHTYRHSLEKEHQYLVRLQQ